MCPLGKNEVKLSSLIAYIYIYMYNTLYVCVYLQGIRGGGVFAGLPWAQRGLEGNNLMTFITTVTFGKCWTKAKSFPQ